MLYSMHARDMMDDRGIDADDVERTVVPGHYVGARRGARVYVRCYGQNGMHFVVTCSADGGTIITIKNQKCPYMGV